VIPDPALVDFGDGRRLERLGGILVDRPHPAAVGRRARPDLWQEATAVFEGDARTGAWRFTDTLPSPWLVTVPLGEAGHAPAPPPTIRLHVRPAPSGQLGIFLEQLPLWRRLHAAWRRGSAGNDGRRGVLSLFAHTGGATMAVAAAGAEVFHVDASRQAIRTARDNAAASGLADPLIHWVEEDAVRYVQRLVRRGERFHGILLDPPSWGHGPRGEAFSIDRDLEPLVSQLAGLLEADGFLMLTSHSPGWDAERLSSLVAAACPAAARRSIDSGPLSCEDEQGRRLALGWQATAGPL
jgi:23S rRNA (cytosine1962-C5)-methyltransferase